MIEMILFSGLFSLVALYVSIIHIQRHNHFVALGGSLVSIVSIVVSCYCWLIALKRIGQQTRFLGYDEYPFILYLVSTIVIIDLILLTFSLILIFCKDPKFEVNRCMFLSAVGIILLYIVTVGLLTKNNSIIGTWIGDGNFDVPYTVFPLEYATCLEFNNDGTVFVEAVNNNSNTVSEELIYSLTRDTITVQKDGLNYGILFDVKGDELHFGTNGVFGIYYRE